MQAGATLPSIRAIAAEHGVAQITVRRALAALKTEGVLEPSIKRRLRVAPALSTDGVEEGAILLIAGNNLHTLLVPPFRLHIQQGIEYEAGNRNAPLMVLHDEFLRQNMPQDILDYPLRGILLIGMFRKEVLRQYERLPVPVVMTDRPPEQWKLHAVSVDNLAAAFDATTRLIQLGHRRIAFLRFVQMGLRDIDPDSKERQKGFRKALAKHGLPTRNVVFNRFPNETPRTSSIRAMFDQRPRFTAAVAVDGGAANDAIQQARDHGLSVPRDLSVVCFGTESDVPQGCSGPRIDFVELGRRAVRVLGHPRRPVVHERIGTSWEQGKTIAPPPPSATRMV